MNRVKKSSTYVKEMLVEGEGFKNKGGSVWIGRERASSVVAIRFVDVARGSETSEL